MSTIVAATLALTACSEPVPTATLPIFEDAAMGVVANGGRNATAHLTGEAERPTPRETRATGQAIFHLSKDGTELRYKLIVANIENVVQAHIHLGGPESSGNFVVFLFGPVAAGGGRVSGVLSEGVITEADFVNDLEGESMQTLIDHILNNNAYVNVHTNDGIGPTNTGPGDFPGGEVRGQIR